MKYVIDLDHVPEWPGFGSAFTPLSVFWEVSDLVVSHIEHQYKDYASVELQDGYIVTVWNKAIVPLTTAQPETAADWWEIKQENATET